MNKKQKIKKGDFGYIQSQKKKRTIYTILALIPPLTVFFVGWIINKDRNTVTPQKDYAVIVQSVGRIARTFDGKEQPIAYDYVDCIRSLQKSFKQRCTSYRKCGCEFIGD